MPAQAIDNIQELKKQVLDKQDTLLSKDEVKKLNDISANIYGRMKDDIANHEVTWKGETISVQELVKNIGADGKVRINENDAGEYIRRGSELGAWVQIFLISHGYDVVKNNKLSGSVDGKLGRFTHKAISMYKGDAKNREDIDINRDYISENKEKIDGKVLSDIKQRLQGATEYSKGRKKPIKVEIIDENKPFVVSVENYGKTTIVDLEKGTLTFEGELLNWKLPKLDKVDGKINIKATSDDNQTALEQSYRQAGLLNYIFGKFINLKGWKYGDTNKENANSENPFYHSTVSLGGSEPSLNFNNGLLWDTDIVTTTDLHTKMGVPYDKINAFTNELNRLYKKFK